MRMATFRGDISGFTVREGRETLKVEAWGDSGVRVRSTLGPCITETPGSALTEPGPTHVSIEISDDRARMQSGDLVVEVSSQDMLISIVISRLCDGIGVAESLASIRVGTD